MSTTSYSPSGMVVSADQRASRAGSDILRVGGGAVDAAIAANAVLAVTAPHLCGLGGDLFALVHRDGSSPLALNASGRSGQGADPSGLRAEGHATMPLFDDIRTVTVPGCVDGWLALHADHGTLTLEELFAPAIALADNGFEVSPLLAKVAVLAKGKAGAGDIAAAGGTDTIRRPGVARTLRAIAEHGRAGFYHGEFGEGLLKLGEGLFTASDLERDNADWVEPLGVNVFGHRVWTAPPNSQGYLLALGLAVADGLDLPESPDDPSWAHLLIEASRVAGYDRPRLLHEGFDAAGLLASDEVERRRGLIDPAHRAGLGHPAGDGDTTYLCAADSSGRGVSLIQSNASGFGSRIFEPSTGIGLHNRGLGFSLVPGSPAEYSPGRRPPHTLAPAVVTRPNGRLRALVGTMGGDSQPQILTQVITRLLHGGQSPAEAIDAPRWRIANRNGFDTWADPGSTVIDMELAAPDSWNALESLGHRVSRVPDTFGHAQLIEADAAGMFDGAADPRARIGAVEGL
ncbi:MAG TPA: gamma-glutamyltransferase [Stackebrandtia sp.]|uniref:gamma-glutamyltransferase family protein n=1 Tax=Stackebrandtia sp. TaxID=2023065 RepID=UPI002D30D0C4|nr:gamma-glutamyltransferase [Stackebrandtia sp.]HZE40054.1 gamma-glutamyltransferase [Stackebrandtia sp.]